METSPEPESPNDSLQFDHAEPANAGGQAATATAAACAGCQQPIINTYYAIGGKPLCERCREGVLSVFKGGSKIARFFKALLLGIFAALISAGVWMAIIKLTGYEVGLVAIVVGLFVGGAVRKGANAQGGWVYQGMAIILTYLAITGHYVPLVIEAMGQNGVQEYKQLVDGNFDRSRISIDGAGEVSVNGKAATVDEAVQEVQRIKSVGGFVLYHRQGRGDTDSPASADTIGSEWDRLEVPVVYCRDPLCEDVEYDFMSFSKMPLMGKGLLLFAGFFVAVQAPFLEGASGFLGIVIIGIGLLQAWRMNKRPILDITGPHLIAPGVVHAAAPMAIPQNESSPSAWDNNPKHTSIDRDRKS